MRDLVLARVLMEPTMAVMRKQLWIGGEAFQRLQDASGLPSLSAEQHRQFRFSRSARGELDAQFQRHMTSVLKSAELWLLIPRRHRTEYTRCLAFRVAANIAAEYNRCLTFAHKLPPFMLFAAFQNPDVAQRLKGMREACRDLLDPFTLAFMDQYDIEDEHAQMIILLI